jgi:hypothetical protein
MNMTYRIKVRKGDSEVEVEGDKQWVEDKFKELTVEKPYAPKVSEAKTGTIPNTLVEFLQAKGNPQKHTELVIVFAYWLLKAEKVETFNVRDIISCYDKTRRVKPSNANQIINTDVRSNLLAQASDKKDGYMAWFLTHTGEQVVENMK